MDLFCIFPKHLYFYFFLYLYFVQNTRNTYIANLFFFFYHETSCQFKGKSKIDSMAAILLRYIQWSKAENEKL